MSLNSVKDVYVNSLRCSNKSIKSKEKIGRILYKPLIKSTGKMNREDLQMKLGREMVKILKTETSTLTSDTMPKVKQCAEHLAGN